MRIYVPSDFREKISLKYVYSMCGGENISPFVKWENYPSNTKSFAITMFDPDAPTEHGWWHWIVVNIPININEFPEDAGNPKSKFFNLGFQTINDYGEIGYGGPCPPPGPAHRYILSVYALSVEGFEIDRNTNPQIVADYIQKYSIDSASALGKYKRGW